MGFYIVEAGVIVCVEDVQGAMAGFVEMEGARDGYKVGLLGYRGSVFSGDGHVCAVYVVLDSSGLEERTLCMGFGEICRICEIGVKGKRRCLLYE